MGGMNGPRLMVTVCARLCLGDPIIYFVIVYWLFYLRSGIHNLNARNIKDWEIVDGLHRAGSLHEMPNPSFPQAQRIQTRSPRASRGAAFGAERPMVTMLIWYTDESPLKVRQLRILIVFYSWKGHTETLARALGQKTGGTVSGSSPWSTRGQRLVGKD